MSGPTPARGSTASCGPIERTNPLCQSRDFFGNPCRVRAPIPHCLLERDLLHRSRSPTMIERRLFLEARNLAGAGERADFLEHACAGDEGLKDRVLSLLREHEVLGNFL